MCAVYGSLLQNLLNLRAGGNFFQILCKTTQKKQKNKYKQTLVVPGGRVLHEVLRV